LCCAVVGNYTLQLKANYAQHLFCKQFVFVLETDLDADLEEDVDLEEEDRIDRLVKFADSFIFEEDDEDEESPRRKEDRSPQTDSP